MKKSLCHKLPTLILLICVTLLSATYTPSRSREYGNTKPENIHVVFDLGGVLIKTAKSTAISKLGKWNLVRYALQTGKNPRDIKKRVYKLLNRIQPTGNICGACDPEGDLMPGIMCDWQTGRKSTKEILAIIEPVITNADLSLIEKKVFHNLMNIIFEPKALIETQELIKEGLSFVKACKNKGYTIHVLSNWDAESFALLYNKFPQLFELFNQNDIFASGENGIMKPDPAFFNMLKASVCKKSFNHGSNEVFIMIDDQPENIKSARQCGMYGILCKPKKSYFGMNQKPDFASVYAELACITKHLSPTPTCSAEHENSFA